MTAHERQELVYHARHGKEHWDSWVTSDKPLIRTNCYAQRWLEIGILHWTGRVGCCIVLNLVSTSSGGRLAGHQCMDALTETGRGHGSL